METSGILQSKISPNYLHSNSTSHIGPFSAVAELIDNAYDPDVMAKEFRINKRVIQGNACLVFQDDGAGMDYGRLLKMLSFGYNDKAAFETNMRHLPIGQYGNGFKSGSMRLGKDALVFTVCKNSAGIGFLSQTYLEAIGADCVFVPIVEYHLPNLEHYKSQESCNNLEAILSHCPFHTERELKAELQILSKGCTATGTKIIIYNLKRHNDGKMELDFESDGSDIRNPEAHEVDLTSVYHRTTQVESSEHMRSLRVYCSILFLRPRMKIYIREVKVKTQLISKSLSSTEIDSYKPTWLSKPLRITFGFSTQDPVKEDYGVMFYHRNRLIKAYEKLGYQKQPNDLGIGVVGVVQVDFLKPIHNKQDFEKDEKYNAIMSTVGSKLNDYWNEKKNGASKSKSTPARQLPDWQWVQCDRCLKWRRLPDFAATPSEKDQWMCYMNPDPTHNRCDIAEEPEDEEEAVKRTSYAKTYKKKQAAQKKQQKKSDMAAKEAELKAREAALLEAQKQQEMEKLFEMAAGSTNDCSVSSTSKQSGQKRRSSVGGGRRKVMNITTDQGKMRTIERTGCDKEAEGQSAPEGPSADVAAPVSKPGKSARPGSSKPTAAAKRPSSTPSRVAKRPTSTQRATKDARKGAGGAEGGGGGDLNSKVKAGRKERSSPLQEKYQLLTQRFDDLQRNVHKLLSLIRPDVDLGPEEDIEHIVTEMIRDNSDQQQS